MGMFDDITLRDDCQLPDDDHGRRHFQTKDLVCWMDSYRIGAVGSKLEKFCFETRETGEQRLDKFFNQLFPVTERVNERWEEVTPMHQDVNFYAYDPLTERSIDYVARYTNNVLQGIQRGEVWRD